MYTNQLWKLTANVEGLSAARNKARATGCTRTLVGNH